MFSLEMQARFSDEENSFRFDITYRRSPQRWSPTNVLYICGGGVFFLLIMMYILPSQPDIDSLMTNIGLILHVFSLFHWG